MVSVKRKSGYVEIDAEYLNDLAADTAIAIDDEDTYEAEDKKAAKTLIPKEWQVDKAAEEFAEGSKEGFGYEMTSLRKNIEIATFKLKSDDLIIDADPPPSHEVWHLRDCLEYKEAPIEYDDRFRQALPELEKCPTLIAMKDDYKISMFKNPSNREAVLKMENEKEILYFNEDWMAEQLMRHRGIDINSEKHVELLQEATDFKIDMTLEKIARGESQNIVSNEEADFRTYLNSRSYRPIHAQDKDDLNFYFTPYGYIVEFEKGGNIADTYALAQKDTVITDQNGNELNLEDYLRKEYHVDLKGNYIENGRDKPGPDQSSMLADEEEHQKPMARPHDRGIEIEM